VASPVVGSPIGSPVMGSLAGSLDWICSLMLLVCLYVDDVASYY
jgi:hypothetical protein